MIGTGNDTDIRITLGTSDVEIYLGDEKVYPNTPPDYSLMYFTTEGIYDENTVIQLSNYTSAFEYSKDGVEWHSTGTSDTVFNLGLIPGEKAYWRCTNPNIDSTNGIGHFNGTHPFKVYGNIMSLVYGENFEGQTSLSGKNYIFINLLSNNANLMEAENLILPATTLASNCYNHMFYGCTSLATAPVLPATTLASWCYKGMFSDCRSLTTAPELPATTLVNYCYNGMFYNCTSLATAPVLPATTLAMYCYTTMFYGCTSLATAPVLPATTLAMYCYNGMFQGCTNLTTAPELPATTLASWCYISMFQNCTNLTTAPVLPAETLASYCYQNMFNGCTSMTTAPELPVTTLKTGCYNGMFQGCTNLTTAPELPATTLASYCYQSMFYGCTKLNYIKAMFTTTPSNTYTQNWVNGVSATGTFVKNSAATWNVTGVNGVPTGWTIQRASQ